MNDFAAIDFETANNMRSSVCSVGIVIVRDREITQTFYRLIHPYPDYYNWFTQIHGITSADTQDAPDFPEVWAEIAPHLAGLPLAAHYSVFDESCLQAAHEAYNMAYPGYTFFCTCETSRRVFGRALPNHKLPTVAEQCGYHIEQHHHALADAEACAHIAMQIL